MNLLSLLGVSKYQVIATVGIVALALGSGFAIGWHEKSLRVPALLKEQADADAKACKTEQDKTKEKNDELVIARNRIATDLANYKRLHPSVCLYQSGDGKLRPAAGEHAVVYGVSTGWLREYAAVCENLRSQLAVCTEQSY